MKYILILFIFVCALACETQHHQYAFIVEGKRGNTTYLRAPNEKRGSYRTREINAFREGDTVWLFKKEFYQNKPQF